MNSSCRRGLACDVKNAASVLRTTSTFCLSVCPGAGFERKRSRRHRQVQVDRAHDRERSWRRTQLAGGGSGRLLGGGRVGVGRRFRGAGLMRLFVN
jgi:hypothetical protein